MNNEEFMKLLFAEIKEVRNELSDIKKEMTTLKVKVALFSSVIGSAATFLINKIIH